MSTSPSSIQGQFTELLFFAIIDVKLLIAVPMTAIQGKVILVKDKSLTNMNIIDESLMYDLCNIAMYSKYRNILLMIFSIHTDQ